MKSKSMANSISSKNLDSIDKKINTLKNVFQKKGLVQEIYSDLKERPSLFKMDQIFKNYGYINTFIIEGHSSGEDSDMDEENIPVEATMKDVMNTIQDYATIQITKKLEEYPEEARPSAIFLNIDEWVTPSNFKQFIEESPCFTANKQTPEIESIIIDKYRKTPYAIVEFKKAKDLEKLYNYYTHPMKKKFSPTKNSKGEVIEFHLTYNLLDLTLSNWFGVVLRNLPQNCTHENLKSFCESHSTGVLYALYPMRIKSSICSIVVLKDLDDAEKLCQVLNKKEVVKNKRIKAHLHPKCCKIRQNPEKSHLNKIIAKKGSVKFNEEMINSSKVITKSVSLPKICNLLIDKKQNTNQLSKAKPEDNSVNPAKNVPDEKNKINSQKEVKKNSTNFADAPKSPPNTKDMYTSRLTSLTSMISQSKTAGVKVEYNNKDKDDQVSTSNTNNNDKKNTSGNKKDTMMMLGSLLFDMVNKNGSQTSLNKQESTGSVTSDNVNKDKVDSAVTANNIGNIIGNTNNNTATSVDVSICTSTSTHLIQEAINKTNQSNTDIEMDADADAEDIFNGMSQEEKNFYIYNMKDKAYYEAPKRKVQNIEERKNKFYNAPDSNSANVNTNTNSSTVLTKPSMNVETVSDSIASNANVIVDNDNKINSDMIVDDKPKTQTNRNMTQGGFANNSNRTGSYYPNGNYFQRINSGNYNKDYNSSNYGNRNYSRDGNYPNSYRNQQIRNYQKPPQLQHQLQHQNPTIINNVNINMIQPQGTQTNLASIANIPGNIVYQNSTKKVIIENIHDNNGQKTKIINNMSFNSISDETNETIVLPPKEDLLPPLPNDMPPEPLAERGDRADKNDKREPGQILSDEEKIRKRSPYVSRSRSKSKRRRRSRSRSRSYDRDRHYNSRRRYPSDSSPSMGNDNTHYSNYSTNVDGNYFRSFKEKRRNTSSSSHYDTYSRGNHNHSHSRQYGRDEYVHSKREKSNKYK